MKRVFQRLAPILGDPPVLIDVGASGYPPAVWESLAPTSIFVGFDPDSREMRESPGNGYLKTIISNEAVTADPECHEVSFYLTRSPYCSSTLKPLTGALSDYIFSDLFIVERETRVRAATLDSILDRIQLDRVDWLKIDTQGTDLRIYKSLSDDIRRRVLAVEVEPGLIDVYEGEDLFIHAHRELQKEGFWLSTLNTCGTVRMKKSTTVEILRSHSNLDQTRLERTIRPSPGWCEARYLRSLDWLAGKKTARREYALLWIFSIVERQFGYALDIAIEHERLFGRDEFSALMRDYPVELIRKDRFRVRASGTFSFLSRAAGSVRWHWKNLRKRRVSR